MTKADRRVQRTRQLLQKALIELMQECGYDAITIQDIVDRANVGRTTFYLHYHDKDDLFMSCHDAIVSEFAVGSHVPRSRADLLSPNAPTGMIAAIEHLETARALLYPILHGKDGHLLLRRIRAGIAQDLEASLRAAFVEAESSIPIDLLATYLAGAQIALVHWWMEKRQPHTPEALAQVLQRVQRAAICDAFGLSDTE